MDCRIALGDQISHGSPAAAGARRNQTVRVLLQHLLAGFCVCVQQVHATGFGPVRGFLELGGFPSTVAAPEQGCRSDGGVESGYKGRDVRAQRQSQQAGEGSQARQTHRKIVQQAVFPLRLFRFRAGFRLRSALHALDGAPHVRVHLTFETPADIDRLIDESSFQRLGDDHQGVRLVADRGHQPVQTLQVRGRVLSAARRNSRHHPCCRRVAQEGGQLGQLLLTQTRQRSELQPA